PRLAGEAQPRHAAERRRNADRAPEVRPPVERRHPARHGARGSAGAAAGRAALVVWIPGRADEVIEALPGERQIAAVALAEERRAGAPQRGIDRRLLVGHAVAMPP